MDDQRAALEYHQHPTPGKIAITATKPLMTQRDLALAYSPGVAAASLAIVADAAQVSNLTVRGNLVAVITNGTAVLGLGDIGPLAAKPVMEGKAVLFKKFAGLDAIDIEIAENDPERLIDIIAALEPTFGAINLEDIKAPECFRVESELKRRMKIPVFHDDQHGTSIIVAAAVVNWLRISKRSLSDVKLVASGAGAAALTCMDLLVSMGLPIENIRVSDILGVVYRGRAELTCGTTEAVVGYLVNRRTRWLIPPRRTSACAYRRVAAWDRTYESSQSANAVLRQASHSC
jgi:malate dehydrogenase (oxaloacetate-decarboxylating)(NADP+)